MKLSIERFGASWFDCFRQWNWYRNQGDDCGGNQSSIKFFLYITTRSRRKSAVTSIIAALIYSALILLRKINITRWTIELRAKAE